MWIGLYGIGRGNINRFCNQQQFIYGFIWTGHLAGNVEPGFLWWFYKYPNQAAD